MRRRGLVMLAVLLTGTTCSGVGPFGAGHDGEIAIVPGQIVLGAIGARRQLGLTDGNGTALPPGNGVSWSSSNPGVAAVDGAGTVTATRDGEATITATLGNEQATALVTVAAAIETSIAVTAADQSDADPSDNQVVTTITVVAP